LTTKPEQVFFRYEELSSHPDSQSCSTTTASIWECVPSIRNRKMSGVVCCWRSSGSNRTAPFFRHSVTKPAMSALEDVTSRLLLSTDLNRISDLQIIRPRQAVRMPAHGCDTSSACDARIELRTCVGPYPSDLLRTKPRFVIQDSSPPKPRGPRRRACYEVLTSPADFTELFHGFCKARCSLSM